MRKARWPIQLAELPAAATTIVRLAVLYAVSVLCPADEVLGVGWPGKEKGLFGLPVFTRAD